MWRPVLECLLFREADSLWRAEANTAETYDTHAAQAVRMRRRELTKVKNICMDRAADSSSNPHS